MRWNMKSSAMDGLARFYPANPKCVDPYSTPHMRHAWLDAPFSWAVSYPYIHHVHSLVASSLAPLSISVKISKFLSKVTSVGSCSSQRQRLSIASDCTTNLGLRIEPHKRSMKATFRAPVRLIALEYQWGPPIRVLLTSSHMYDHSTERAS
jgi:hypothetical protein